MTRIKTTHVGSLPRTQEVVGFTFAGFGAVDPDIAYAKLKALSDGAALASNRR